MRRYETPLKLKNPPLVSVLCQVRFSPILTMKKNVENIQEALRKSGFPKYGTTNLTEILINEENAIKSNAVPRWDFKNENSTTGIFLGTDFITIQTILYKSFEESFANDIKLALSVLANETDVSLVERIGLRYINLLQFPENNIRNFINPSLLGIDTSSFNFKDTLTRFELVGVEDTSKLVLKLQKATEGQFLPSDIDSQSLDFEKIKLKLDDKSKYILDIDHYSLESFKYNHETIFEKIKTHLHNKIENVFLESLTDDAIDFLGGLDALRE